MTEREIVKALAALDEPLRPDNSGDLDCALCGAWISLGVEHDRGCPWAEARKLYPVNKPKI